MLCAQCGKRIWQYKGDINNVYCNIEQNPDKVYFCSRKCKINYIHQLAQKQSILAKIFH